MIKGVLKRILRRAGLERTEFGRIPVTTRQIANILYYGDMYRRLDGVHGSIVECGVGKGRSFLYLNYLAEREGTGRMVWGFDSFEGFPEPSAQDASDRKPKKGDWSDTSEDLIRAVLAVAGISKEWIQGHVRLEKGYFADSLVRYDGAPIALLHLDGDLYESYKDPLDRLFPLVVQGGIVLFDEYDDAKWPGAKKAVDEYFAGTGQAPIRDPRTGKHYLIKQ